jgi:hypothetical protein
MLAIPTERLARWAANQKVMVGQAVGVNLGYVFQRNFIEILVINLASILVDFYARDALTCDPDSGAGPFCAEPEATDASECVNESDHVAPISRLYLPCAPLECLRREKDAFLLVQQDGFQPLEYLHVKPEQRCVCNFDDRNHGNDFARGDHGFVFLEVQDDVVFAP